MRTAVLVSAVVAVLLAAAFFALRLRPRVGGPALVRFSVTVPGTGNVPADEAALAQPLEDQLARLPGLERLRTRVTPASVVIEAHAPEAAIAGLRLDTRILPTGTPPPLVTTLQPSDTAWWSLGNSERSAADQREWAEQNVRAPLLTQAGVREVTFCGPEAPVMTVRLDGQRVAKLGLSLHDVVAALDAPPATAEALGAIALTEQVTLRDVANIGLDSPAPGCIGFSNGPALLMQVRSTPGTKPTSPEGTALGRLYPAVIRWPGDVPPTGLKSFEAVAVLFHPKKNLELLFDHPIDAKARGILSGFAAGRPGAALESIDGMEHVTVRLLGPDLEQLQAVAVRAAAALRSTPDVVFVSPLPEQTQRLALEVDRPSAARLGVPLSELFAATALGLQGLRRGPLRIEVDRAESPEHLLELPVHGVPLSELVRLEQAWQPAELLRVNRQRAIEVTAWGIDRKRVPPVSLPSGVTLEIDDES